jgi:hypothetical protein
MSYGRLVTTDQQLGEVGPFTPVQPVTRRRMIVRVVFGPLLWLAALVVAAFVLNRTHAIEIGFAIALVCMAVSLIGLSLIRAARDRERSRLERG